jgi:hypothetical protein
MLWRLDQTGEVIFKGDYGGYSDATGSGYINSMNAVVLGPDGGYVIGGTISWISFIPQVRKQKVTCVYFL